MDFGAVPAISYVIIIWVMFWKGVALWRAAQLKQKYWFVVLIVIGNITFGILEIVYLFRFAKKRLTLNEFKSWFVKEEKKS